MSENLTLKIAERASQITFDDLDAITIAAVKRLIADGVAVAIAGSVEAPPRIVSEYVRDLGAAPRATVWGFDQQTAPVHAAYVNAVSMHVLDFEPMSNPPTHAVSPTLPVAFALTEARGLSGRDLITACAKGFEMQGRVLAAARPKRGSLPFHTPGVVGVMGSAVAAGHLLELTAVQLTHALGMATSRCAGLSANTGSMVKATHCGNVAAAGLEAASLAARGFTSNPGILDAPHGYVATFFPQRFDYDVLMQFGAPYRCVDPGMAIKFFPSKFPTHFVISAALDARAVVGDASKIRSIRIVAPEITDANRPQPRIGLEGKFSFQYCAAAALLDGKVGISTFTDERRFAADMVALLDKITVEYDKSRSKDTREMYVDVEITLTDSTVVSRTCRRPPGAWGEPVNAGRHEAKIRDCLGVRLNPTDVQRVLELLDNLENLSAREFTALPALLACKGN